MSFSGYLAMECKSFVKDNYTIQSILNGPNNDCDISWGVILIYKMYMQSVTSSNVWQFDVWHV